MITIHFIFLGFSFVSMSLGLLFFIKQKGDKVAHWFIGGLLISFAYLLFFSVLFWSKIFFRSLDLTYFLPMAILGPLFYLYLRRVIVKTKINIKILIHLIPLLLIMIFYGGYYLRDVFVQVPKPFFKFSIMSVVTELILTMVLVVYAILSYGLVSKINKKDRDLYLWTKTISIAFSGIVLSYIVYYILGYAKILTPTQDYIIAFMQIIFIAYVGYMAFMQPEIFNGKPISEVIPFIKYNKSGLSKEYSIELKLRLMNLIDEEKIYLRNNIGLIDIAEAINISRNNTSQVINEQFNMSFYDFINSYRIMEAKRIMAATSECNSLNLTEIAYTVGFNNRISFYKAFKKFSGLNPSQYFLEIKNVS